MKEDRIIRYENFIVNNSWKIQLLIIILTAIIGAVVGIKSEDVLNLVIVLFIAVVTELIVLSTKNSTNNRKLNLILKNLKINDSDGFVVFDFNQDRFFKNTMNHFFISGISLGNFIENNIREIGKLLEKKKKVYILFAELEIIPENMKLYCAHYLDEKRFKEDINTVLTKQAVALANISSNNLDQYLENGNLNIGLSKAVVSTSFIANDVLEKVNHCEKEIVATFYQYGCNNTKDNPSILISPQEEKWYMFFKATLQKQWEDAEKIKSIQEFKELRYKIESKRDEYKV